MWNETPGQGNDPTDNPSWKKEEFIAVDERKLRLDHFKEWEDFFIWIDTITSSLLSWAGVVKNRLKDLVDEANNNIGKVEGIDDKWVLEMSNKLNQELLSVKEKFKSWSQEDIAWLIKDIEWIFIKHNLAEQKVITPIIKQDEYSDWIDAIWNREKTIRRAIASNS